MKRASWIAGTLLAIVGMYAWQARAVTRQFAWDYDFTVDRACSAAVTADCVKEFRLKEGATVHATVPAPTLTATVTFGKYGSRSFTVTAVTETGVESEPSNVLAMEVKPGSPKNLR